MKPSDSIDVLKAIELHRQAQERVVFTNGCFDILHVGHVRYLTDAKALGDVLVVGLNSDASVRRLKGPTRPIVPEAERAELLLALKAVDYVLVFDEDTPLELIKQVRPKLLVKGGDWSVDRIVGSDFVASIGGETRSLPFVEGRSTTDIIQRIRQTFPN
ncbi:MAG: D-glycero-beta-D-manno-heptose 1-phosphate adenylyltransferase [Bdellovibrionales bacterium]|nr:D-glycero-beta-D-manno-heptose 1-phosphate adenylyltransferase [Bdellovibrionales bacterium]